jgi:hypothetical protein
MMRFQNGHWVDDAADQNPNQFWDDSWALGLAAGHGSTNGDPGPGGSGGRAVGAGGAVAGAAPAAIAADDVSVAAAAAVGAGTAAPSAIPADDVSVAGSGLHFHNTYSSTVSAGYHNAVIAAEQTMAGLWTNSITLNMNFDTQSPGQNGNLAYNTFGYVTVNYAQLKSALTSHASSAEATAAVATLPSSDPSNNGNVWYVPEAYARMLGLSSATPTIDDTVVLNISYGWSYGQDVTDVVMHEISEGGMGRVGGLGDVSYFVANAHEWWTMDLFRYSSANTRDYTDGRDGLTTHFSYNGTDLSSLSFNNEYNSSNQKVNGGDTADFTQQDVFGTGNTGETNTLSTTDKQIINTLGWTPMSAGMKVDYFYAVESKTGDEYIGYTYDNAAKYYNGESWTSATTDQLGGHWSYTIYSVGAADNAHQNAGWNGYTFDTYYYDTDKANWYLTYYGGANGTPTSSTGIGPDFDYIYQNGLYQPFGSNGYYVVPETMKVDYFYAVESKTGDEYIGYTYDNKGTYVNGESWTSATADQLGGHWSYTIYSVGAADSAHQDPGWNGYTFDTYYYDTDKANWYLTYYGGANGAPTSSTGIGPDFDYIYQNGAYQPFGSNGYYVVPETMKIDYFYAVESKTGDEYIGYTYDNLGTYVNGQTWTSATTDQLGGHWSYTIYSIGTADSGHQNPGWNGYTYDSYYYDTEDSSWFLTYYGGANGTPTSSTGIGPDYDYIYQNGNYKAFGLNGYYVVNDGGGSPHAASGNGGSNPDTFIFVGNFGQQTVDGFTPGNQTIALDHNEFADFSAVLEHAVQVEADVVITLDDHDAITLKNLMLSSLHASDFHFA